MSGTCAYTECDRSVHRQGWCRMHFERVRKTGSPDGGKIVAPMAVRFMRQVIKDTGTDCWDWAASKDRHGYPRIGRDGYGNGVARGHRVSYEIHHGSIPEGGIVMHTCDNPSCTNPDHLRLGTLKENTADMLAKGRGRWGSKRPELVNSKSAQ